jgi:2-oxoisovalerate dehydrogenase E2 component (dihydrolipoyl transacylase)
MCPTDRPLRHRLVVPDLGLGPTRLVVSLWLIPEGSRVAAGDRVVELLADGVTVDLEAPVSGRLAARFADEDDPVCTGAVLAEFEVPE